MARFSIGRRRVRGRIALGARRSPAHTRKSALRFEPLELRALLATGPVISEFMASNNSTLLDEDGDSSDWIEVFNGTSSPIELQGWHLTDSAGDLDRWEFPAVTLDAGGYLVVFASGKDRRDPAAALHTDFSLDADGELLALVEPDGTTIAHQFAPQFPEQRVDISYGISQRADVVDVGAEWSYFVPTDGSLGNSWQEIEFDDAAWQTGPSTLGFGVRRSGFNVRVVYASDQVDAITSLSQAESLLSLSSTSPLIDRVATDVTPVVNFFDTGGDGHFGDNLPFPGDSPAGDDRFVVHVTGTISVPQPFPYTFGINSDEGARLRIDGTDVIVDNSLHAPADTLVEVPLTSGSHELELIYFENEGGAELELFATRGPYSSFNNRFRLVGDDRSGLSVFTMDAAFFATDLRDELSGVHSSAFFRHELDVADPQSIDAMTLGIRYDDAFVAYLNGTEIARRGVTGATPWNATADAPRSTVEALRPEMIPLGQFTHLLQEGTNVLAIHALTAGINDESFLLEPQLFFSRSGGTEAYFSEPTPELPNGEGISGIVQEPTVSVEHGLYVSPFTVALSTPTEGATIRYTTDGSDPSGGNGTVYRGPITIDRTTTLRAAASLDDHLDSRVATQTYIFLEDVIRQPSRPPAGWPLSFVNGQRLDYGMDPEIVGGVYTEEQVVESLRALPSISMVTDLDHLFDSRTGIYVNAGNRGDDWERPVSVELINPDGGEGFQVDAGMRIRGGFSRQGNNPKHAFRLFFRSQYGDAALEYPLFGDEGVDTFQNIDLRTAQNYSWAFSSSGEMSFTREVFARDTQRDMDRPYTRSRYYHLYVNGQYWGVFQTQERSEADFAASYFGGSPDDYDVIKSTGNFGGYTIEATDGQMDAWSDLWDLAVAFAQSPSARSNNYWTMQGLRPDGTRDESLPILLDVDALIDYMIITFYMGNTDAPLSNFLGNDRPNNWFGIYNRETADRGFQFFQHDAEHTLGTSGSSGDRTGPYFSGNRFTLAYSNPQFLHQHLMAHPEYRLRWADRAQMHLFNGGALTEEESLKRFNARVEQVDGAIVAESARWGDASRSFPFTRTEWLAQINEVRRYFHRRETILLTQLRRDDLYPAIDAPELQPHGGTVPANTSLQIVTADGSGTIYYTLDGSDPRRIGGGISPQATVFRDPVELTESVTVTARVWQGGAWSALVKADFLVAEVAADASNLRISEINYNPYAALPQFGDHDVDNDEFEFIELININQAETISLVGVTFTDGIEFDFTDSEITQLGPLQRVIVVRNAAAFASRYGSELPVAGQFAAGALANEGERIEIRDRDGNVIQSFSYNDSGDWPERADGDGSSLVVADINDNYDAADNWRASSSFGGGPGLGDPPIVDVIVNEVLANPESPQSDTIELFNTLDTDVDIGGWWLSDSGNNLFKYRIPAGMVLPAGGYAALTEFNGDFRLSESDDDVWLVAADASGRPLRFADNVSFDASLEGVSLGRVPSGDPRGQLFPLAATSLGAANGDHRPGEIVISEIHYHPPAPPAASGIAEDQLEFVELYNRTAAALDLAGWVIRGGIDFDFVASTRLEPGASVVLVSFDPADPLLAPAFRLVQGIGPEVVLVGPYLGRLDNGGEEIRVMAPTEGDGGELAHYLVDRVRYDDAAPWPAEPDGTGPSLTRRTADNYGDAADSWQTGAPSPGSTDFDPGTLEGDFDGNGRVEQGDLDLVLSNWGRPATPVPVDWVHDLPQGIIDQDELDAVLLNWGTSRATAQMAVAESAAVVLQIARADRAAIVGDRSTIMAGHASRSSNHREQANALGLSDDSTPRQDVQARQLQAKDSLFGNLDLHGWSFASR